MSLKLCMMVQMYLVPKYVVETIYSGTLDDNFSIFESGEYEEY